MNLAKDFNINGLPSFLEKKVLANSQAIMQNKM
jgi:hypothetical protein